MIDQHALLRRALATILSVEQTHPNLDRLCTDLVDVLPDWFALYYEGPRFHAQAEMNFEDGTLYTWRFAPTRKRRRSGRAA